VALIAKTDRRPFQFRQYYVNASCSFLSKACEGFKIVGRQWQEPFRIPVHQSAMKLMFRQIFMAMLHIPTLRSLGPLLEWEVTSKGTKRRKVEFLFFLGMDLVDDISKSAVVIWRVVVKDEIVPEVGNIPLESLFVLDPDGLLDLRTKAGKSLASHLFPMLHNMNRIGPMADGSCSRLIWLITRGIFCLMRVEFMTKKLGL
jgi:hypothetical protein